MEGRPGQRWGVPPKSPFAPLAVLEGGSQRRREIGHALLGEGSPNVVLRAGSRQPGGNLIAGACREACPPLTR